MVMNTQPKLIAVANENWQWEAALLHIWNVIQDEDQWSSIPQPMLRCNDITVSMKNKDAFVQYYLAKLLAHRKGWFIITLNIRDSWGIIHNTRRWAFISKTEVLEER